MVLDDLVISREMQSTKALNKAEIALDFGGKDAG